MQKFPKKVIVSLGKGSTFAPANDGERVKTEVRFARDL